MVIDRPGCTRRAASLAALAALLPAGTSAQARMPAPAAPFAPLLATVYTGQVAPALCLISEKYDGIRALWDGRVLRHRSGRVVSAPTSFLARLPPLPLDGELWLGRGRFDALSAIVRRQVPAEPDWQRVRYLVFEPPGADGSFAERAARLRELGGSPGWSGAPCQPVPQAPGADGADLRRRLDAVVAAGGEGLMLHVASASQASGRDGTLMKLKPHRDAEATVIGHYAGSGKYRGQLGALRVETRAGKRLYLGSGFSDAERVDPPPIGSEVTYRYRDLTPAGVPRFATYLRRHEAL